MSKCRFSPQARDDLRDIHDFIASDKPIAALRFIERLEAACEQLGEHPLLGEACEEIGHDLRMFTVGNYVLFYRRFGHGVEIARVIHGARDWRRLF